MKLDFKPGEVMKELPGVWLEQYHRYVGAEEGSSGLEDSRRLVRVGLIAVGLFFILFLLWAAFAPMSGAAIAPGTITVAGNRQQVQSLNGGMVEAVLVAEGDTVQGGQILLRLNGVSADAKAEQQQNAKDALRVAEARLIAERDGAAQISVPPDVATRAGAPIIAQALASQQALFVQRRAVRETDGGIARAKYDQARVQAEGARQRLDLAREELGMFMSLYNRGFATKTSILRLQANVVSLETEASTNEAIQREAELTYRKAEEERTGRVLDELRQVQADLAQVDPELRSVRYSAESNLIRAPLAGRVVGLSVFGPGAVLTGGQKLMEILPTGRALLVQARVKPQDIDDVKVGAEAHVRLTTVNPRGKSSFKGRVTILSADQLPGEAGAPGYYLALVALDAEELGKAGVQLQAGLPATVNITTSKRTLLGYLFSPLGDALSGAMREE